MSIGKRFEYVGRWLLFSVIIALLPIVSGILILFLFQRPITIQNTISHSAINNTPPGSRKIDAEAIAIISFIVFGWTMLTGIGSKWVAEN